MQLNSPKKIFCIWFKGPNVVLELIKSKNGNLQMLHYNLPNRFVVVIRLLEITRENTGCFLLKCPIVKSSCLNITWLIISTCVIIVDRVTNG